MRIPEREKNPFLYDEMKRPANNSQRPCYRPPGESGIAIRPCRSLGVAARNRFSLCSRKAEMVRFSGLERVLKLRLTPTPTISGACVFFPEMLVATNAFTSHDRRTE